jgi:transposase
MYVAVVPNRSSPPAILLRESFREGGKVRNRTLANLSHWPPAKVDALRRALKGQAPAAAVLPDTFSVTRSRPHGHVAAVLAMIERLGLPALLDPVDSPRRRAAVALIAARLLEPCSKLAAARALRRETARSTLGETLGLERIDEDDLYQAMDWLLPRQPAIEAALASRHLRAGTLVLYDLTSTYFEGRRCPLARLGYSRDERRGNPQIVFGLLSDPDGRPIAVEVFPGETGDPKTVAAQVAKLRERFHLERVVLVGDRGMLTHKRIEQDLSSHAGLEWVTALRAPQIQTLAADGALQMSLFDERELAEITHPDYPGERLIVCRNPLLADERVRKRAELVAAAERKLRAIQAAVGRKRNPLRGEAAIAYRVGQALARTKMAKYFRWRAAETSFAWERDAARIERDAALDGVYVLRTNTPAERLDAAETVLAYKRLARVERAFRTLKSVDLEMRPIRHRLAERVRAHVLLAMLAYYVEWHLRQALAPLLFDDEHGGGERSSPVAPAVRSEAARAKASSKRTAEGWPVQSLRDWLGDLATIAKNTIQPAATGVEPFDVITRPTPAQRQALELLQVSL